MSTHVIVGNTHPGGMASHGQGFVVISGTDPDDWICVHGSTGQIGIQPAVHIEGTEASRPTLLLVVCDPAKLEEIEGAIRDSQLFDDIKRKLTELARSTATAIDEIAARTTEAVPA